MVSINDEEEYFKQLKRYQKPKNSFNTEGEDDFSIVDPAWETIDPTPDVYSLFVVFDQKFFWSQLQSVEVKWSKRMTSCAGICSYNPRGGSCVISLSEPLLKLRPRKDLVETLLHEMIHAFLFVTRNDRDRDGHGPRFCEHMNRINRQTGTKISIYHNFHDEVRVYLVHWWRCTGPCQNWKPFYGFVKRSMNRAPGPNDRWWKCHQQHCNGTFVKVKEPEKTSKSKKTDLNKSLQTADIRSYFKDNKDNQNTSDSNDFKFSESAESTSGACVNSFVPFTGTGFTLLESNLPKPQTSPRDQTRNVWASKFPSKRHVETTDDLSKSKKANYQTTINETNTNLNCSNEESNLTPNICLICNNEIIDDLNTHLELCLSVFDEEMTEENAAGTSNNDSYVEDSDVTIIETQPIVIDLSNDDDCNNSNEMDDDFVDCPCCPRKIRKTEINEHLDLCLVEDV